MVSKFTLVPPAFLVLVLILSFLYFSSFIRHSPSGPHVCLTIPKTLHTALGLIPPMPSPRPSCSDIFQYGVFPTNRSSSVLWKPMTCQSSLYSNGTESLPLCLKKLFLAKRGNRTVIELYGDSRMRQIQQEMGKIISGRPIDRIEFDENCKCNRSVYCDPADTATKNLPWIHEHCLFKEQKILVTRWQQTLSGSGQPEVPLEYLLTEARKHPPDVVLMNSGAHLLHRCQSQSLSLAQCTDQYRGYLYEIRPLLSELAKLTSVIWLPQNMVNRSSSLKHFPGLYDVILPSWNMLAYRVFLETGVHFFWSLLQFFDFFGDNGDGLHLGPLATHYTSQIVFNFLCRSVTEYSPGTCCGNLDHKAIDELERA